METWKRHPVYKGYEFSSLGRVRTEAGEIHGRPVGKMGYHGISVEGVTLYIHREVASLFVPNPGNLKYVVHGNGDLWDNRDTNLEWRAKRSPHKVNPDSPFGAKLTESDRKWIREHYQPGHRLFGQGGMAKKFGVTSQAINAVVNG